MNKQFSITYNSISSGKTEREAVSADSFFVSGGFLQLVDEQNKPVAAFQSAQVERIVPKEEK